MASKPTSTCCFCLFFTSRYASLFLSLIKFRMSKNMTGFLMFFLLIIMEGFNAIIKETYEKPQFLVGLECSYCCESWLINNAI